MTISDLSALGVECAGPVIVAPAIATPCTALAQDADRKRLRRQSTALEQEPSRAVATHKTTFKYDAIERLWSHCRGYPRDTS
jgi:hypothetical protein